MTVQTLEKPRTYTLSGWDLSELLPEPSESLIIERLGQVEESVQTFEGLRDKLSPEMDPEILVAAVRQYESLIEQVQRLGGYGSLWFSADTQSPDALTFRNRMQQVFTDAQNRMLFFSLWWKSLDDEQADLLLPNAAEKPD